MAKHPTKLVIIDTREVRDLPKIVCLCGSTKFKDEYINANQTYTLAGYIVLTVGCFPHSDKIKITKSHKQLLDKLHLRKIDLADEVFVINVNNYIGESTAREISYAVKHNKVVRYLEPNGVI